MDFKGIGKIPYEIPSASLKPFFRRKYATVFRSYDKTGKGIIRKSDILLWADRSGNYIQNMTPGKYKAKIDNNVSEFMHSNWITDLEARTKYVTELTNIFEEYILFGKESITEKEYINQNMRIAFTDRNTREQSLNRWRKNVPYLFDQLDLNHDGVVDYNEVLGIYKIFGCTDETSRLIFDTIDVDGDGYINIDEYGYAALSFYFQSGPDSALSLLFGPLAPEDSI